MLEAYGTAIVTLFQPINLLIMLAAVCIGLVVGIIPGIGGMTMMAILTCPDEANKKFSPR